jgi:hypothetical protein
MAALLYILIKQTLTPTTHVTDFHEWLSVNFKWFTAPLIWIIILNYFSAQIP